MKLNTQIKNQRILLIEDDPGDAIYFQSLLRHTGFQSWPVHHALNLNEALQVIDDFQPDLILLDLSLPDSWGVDTIIRIKEHTSHIPIVITSGLEDEQLALDAVRKGAEDYLIKGSVDQDMLKRTMLYAIERCRLKREMVLSEKRLMSIIHKSLDGILIVDMNGIVLFANPTVAVIFRRRISDILHNPFGYSVDFKDTEEFVLTNDDGHELALELRSVPIEWEKKAAHLVILRDLSEKKRAERLKNDFINYLACVLNEPMNYVDKTIIDLLNDADYEWSDDVKGRLTGISKRVQRIVQMSDNLSLMAKLDSRGVKLFRKQQNVVLILEETVRSFLVVSSEKGIDLKIECSAPNINALVDYDKVRHVFFNLIDNAVKYTKQGQILILLTEVDEQVECIIEDTGSGISKEKLSKLFNRFELMRMESKSYDFSFGLGLAVSKGIIELHQGKIFVESQVGAGTRVTFVLPKKELAYKHQEVRRALTDCIEKYTLFSIAMIMYEIRDESLEPAVQYQIKDKMKDVVAERLNRDHDRVVVDHCCVYAILPDTEKEKGLIVAKRIKAHIESLDALVSKISDLKIRIAVVSFPENGLTEDEILARSDQLMDQQKHFEEQEAQQDIDDDADDAYTE